MTYNRSSLLPLNAFFQIFVCLGALENVFHRRYSTHTYRTLFNMKSMFSSVVSSTNSDDNLVFLQKEPECNQYLQTVFLSCYFVW